MYQSQVRPGSTGRKLVAQQQSEQHPSKQQNPSSRFYRNDIVSAALEPFGSISERARTTVRLILMTGFLAAITGCGGLNYNKLGTAPGSSQGNAVALSEISCGTQSLTGPQSKTCSASLSAAALTTTTVTLSSSSTTLQIPSAVTIAVGQTSATFTAVTAGVNKTVSVTITGVSRGVTKTNVITLYPTPTATLTKVSCAVQSLTGPTATACSVYLSAASTSPIVVSLSSNTSALKVPPTVTIPSGASSASFNATASGVSSTQSASLTATFGGISQSYSIQLVGTQWTGAAAAQGSTKLERANQFC